MTVKPKSFMANLAIQLKVIEPIDERIRLD